MPTSLISTVTGLNFFAAPTYTRLDTAINFPQAAGFVPASGFGLPQANPPGLPGSGNNGGDAFLETGYLNVVTPGNYIFNLNGDDGAVAYVDGILAINGEGANLNTTSIGIPLSAGLHAIQIRINNNGT